MNTSVFKGSATAIITPMNMDGSISYKKMEELLKADLLIILKKLSENAG